MIFIDVDEVLAPFIVPACDFFKSYYGIDISPELVNNFHWYNNPQINELGLTKEIWDEFFQIWKFEQPLFPGAAIFTHQLKKIGTINYITSRPERARAQTMRCLKPCAHATVHMVNRSHRKMPLIRKMRELNDWDHVVLIDDHPETVVDSIRDGIRTYMPRRRHNANVNDDRVIRFNSYVEVISNEFRIRQI